MPCEQGPPEPAGHRGPPAQASRWPHPSCWSSKAPCREWFTPQPGTSHPRPTKGRAHCPPRLCILVLVLEALASPPAPGRGSPRPPAITQFAVRARALKLLEDRLRAVVGEFQHRPRERQRESKPRHVQHPGHASRRPHPHRLHLRLRVRRSRWTGLRLGWATSSSPTTHRHGQRGDASRGRGQHLCALGFNGPDALAFDASGNLYVANDNDNTVERVTPAGLISTFASGLQRPRRA